MSGRKALGPVGRLGRYAATHFRRVLAGWLLVGAVLGFFAPRVETALSGAGWEATGSQSVQARQVIGRDFHGLSSSALQVVVHSGTKTIHSPAFAAAISSTARTLRADHRVSMVVAPQPGLSISGDGHTARDRG